ncbi:MAG: double-strand break repair protein AddB, partial [Pseudomonadota bacterium]
MNPPCVYGVPLGVDFAEALVDGLAARHGARPETLARTTLLLNTSRMERQVRSAFDRGPSRLLPRIGLLDRLDKIWTVPGLPKPVGPLERRLELAQLVLALLQKEDHVAPRSALFDLTDSLASLMSEMVEEGVPPDALDRLDVQDASGHWQRSLAFIGIVRRFADAPIGAARQRLIAEHLEMLWKTAPPKSPVVIAGSTGSRRTSRLLMEAVAQSPMGAVVLPGFDFDLT